MTAVFSCTIFHIDSFEPPCGGLILGVGIYFGEELSVKEILSEESGTLNARWK